MRIYLAGLETTKASLHQEILDDKMIRHGFWSYYYGSSDKQQLFLKELDKADTHLIVDSGAHSFFTEHNSLLATTGRVKKKKEDNDPESYFGLFLQWLHKVYEIIDYYIELDIGELVGQEVVRKWREVLKEKGYFAKSVFEKSVEV